MQFISHGHGCCSLQCVSLFGLVAHAMRCSPALRYPAAIFAAHVSEGESQQEVAHREVEAEPEAALLLGQYSVIRSLTRVLDSGAESKRIVDFAVDKCAAMQVGPAAVGMRDFVDFKWGSVLARCSWNVLRG